MANLDTYLEEYFKLFFIITCMGNLDVDYRVTLDYFL